MSHPDTCWRVAVIHRCCVRYGKDKDWAFAQLDKLRTRSEEGKVITGHGFTDLADIWFRGNTSHIDQVREAHMRGEGYP